MMTHFTYTKQYDKALAEASLETISAASKALAEVEVRLAEVRRVRRVVERLAFMVLGAMFGAAMYGMLSDVIK